MHMPPASASQRAYYVDVMKVCAAFGVVAYHAASPIDLSLQLQLSPADWWLLRCISPLGRSCVPIFIMLSGALLLDPKKNESVQSFFKKRMNKVLYPLCFWSCAYYIWLYVWHDTPLNAQYIITSLINGRPYHHLYYLFLIIGLYILTPVFRIYMRTASKRTQLFFISVSLLLLFIYTGIAAFFFEVTLLQSLNALTMFVPFIGYYLLGGYLNMSDLQKIPMSKIVYMFSIGFFYKFDWGLCSRGTV